MRITTIADALAYPPTRDVPDDTLLYLQNKAKAWRWQPYCPAVANWKDELLRYLAAWLGPMHAAEIVEGPSYAHRKGRSYTLRTWVPGHTHPWFTLAGRSGIGKTLLLGRAIRMLEAMNEGQLKAPVMNGYRGLSIAHIKARDLESYADVQAYARYDLIYLEDVASGIAEGTAGQIAKDRTRELLDARTMRPTLLCTNLSEDKIGEVLDKRIVDRLTRDGGVHLLAPKGTPRFGAIPS